MPDWSEILNEIHVAGSTHDIIRRRYLKELHEVTERNVIVYYSAWLQKSDVPGIEVNDADKTGFMAVIHELDHDNTGLDLILHTPGGEIAAAESLVHYLREMFGTDIRAFVPDLAMSAGTMIACACKEIFMGAHSSLGPTDPQVGGISAHGVDEEFKRAWKEIQKDPAKALVWQPILSMYPPTLIGECEKAIALANEMVTEWLQTGMFQDLDPEEQVSKSKAIVGELSDHALSKSHDRHLSFRRCQEIGLKVRRLEDCPKLREAVLSVHHACIHTLIATPACKIIENHEGKAHISLARLSPQNPEILSQEGGMPPQKPPPQHQPTQKRSKPRRKRK